MVEYLDDVVELRSEVIRAPQREVYLALFGLLGLIASLADEAEMNAEFYGVCLEMARSERIGTQEWAEAISPFHTYRAEVRRERREGEALRGMDWDLD